MLTSLMPGFIPEPILVSMEEEYLEEEIKSDSDLEIHSEFIIEDDDGEPEYLEEGDEEDEDSDPDRNPDPEPEADPEPEPEPEAETEPEQDQEHETELELDQDQDPEQEQDPELDPDPDPEAEEEDEDLKKMLSEESKPYNYGSSVEYIYAEGVSENNEIIIGEVPRFPCKYCDASFKRLDSLYKHNSVHKGKTVCPVCNAVFSRVAHRTRHMRLKHPDVEMVVTSKRTGRIKKEKEIKLPEEQRDDFSVLNTI